MNTKELVEKKESKKRSNLIVRLSDSEHSSINIKSKIADKSMSAIVREGALKYWPEEFDPQKVFDFYIQSDAQTQNQILDMLVFYFKKNGYPHREFSTEELQKEMTKLSNTKSPLLEDNNLQMNNVGIAIGNYFHPHMVEVKCGNNARTPFEQFDDDNLFKDALWRLFELGRKPSFSYLRQILKTRDGVRSVVNFKPPIAKYIYDTYCPDGGDILDPCAGYGGRLAGCIASNRNLNYTGIDPHGRTATGNMRMAETFSSLGWNFNFAFHMGCSEVVIPKITNKFDLIFTSPPYFNVEQYSDEDTQSWIKFPEYKDWKSGFLEALIKNSVNLLKSSGYLILNVKNYKKFMIADDLQNIAKKYGLSLVKTYKMRMPNSDYRLSKENHWHFEPIFVFKKI